MQIYKKTRSRNFNFLSLIIKLLIILIIIAGIVFLLNKVNFPSPNKIIEKKIPNENFKIVK
jgi:heme/copper-type cytochrome/quinol oxidase subunit 4